MTEDPENPATRLLQAASRRGRLAARLAGWGLLLGVAAVAALALTPGLFTQRIPYDDADLGAVATGTIKATRDYAIPDEETSRRMRDEALSSVRAVYEHDPASADEALRRIHDAFAFARGQLGGEVEPAAGGRASGRAEAARVDQLAPHRAEIERRLQARLEDDEFAALAAAGFARDVEDAVSGLVMRALREPVIADREELSPHRDRGIVIRRLGPSGPRADEVLSEVAGIRDLAQVRAQVRADGLAIESLPPRIRDAAADLASREVRSSLKADADLTRKRREDAVEAVKPVVIQLRKGEKIIGDGERIGKRHLLIFAGMRAQSRATDLAQVRLGGGLFVVLLVLVLFGYARGGLHAFRPRKRDLLLLASMLTGMLLVANFWTAAADVLRDRTPEVPLEAWTYAIPFAAGAMLVRAVLGAEAALIFSVALASLCGVLAGGSIQVALFVLLGSLVGADRVARARDRRGIFRAGFLAGMAQAGTVLCFALFAGKLLTWDVLVSAGVAVAGGALLAPMLVLGVTPAVEWAFGYVTDVQLLELANLNHPALKGLIVQAPGTYHHSIIVGTLVEGAAEAIGANPLLARVCAYYHDLGKGLDPLTFGENQRGDNRHDHLPPEESARAIIRHVAGGLEIAKRHGLPAQVVAAIPEHHGTRLVGYFFHKALKEREGRPDLPPVDPEVFRYAGPRPRSRETALVMMADACEAASRAMSDPSAERLNALVKKLIDGIAADGQLDDTELTMRDLQAIARSFARTLESIYHARPDYPAAASGSQAQIAAGDRPEPRRLMN